VWGGEWLDFSLTEGGGSSEARSAARLFGQSARISEHSGRQFRSISNRSVDFAHQAGQRPEYQPLVKTRQFDDAGDFRKRNDSVDPLQKLMPPGFVQRS
jgi:hypothetical protein